MKTTSLALAILVACGGGSSKPAPKPEPRVPSCDELLAHMQKTSIDIAMGTDTNAEDRKYLEDNAASLLPSKEKCATWSDEYKRCIFEATTERTMYQCERDRFIAKGVDMEGPSCETVTSHMLKILIQPILKDDEAFHREFRGRIGDGCLAMPRLVKECVLRAKSQDDFTACAIESHEKFGD
jgi:hypothetical protein